jgi:hypothetical protein
VLSGKLLVERLGILHTSCIAMRLLDRTRGSRCTRCHQSGRA